jgi:hypothetical protein
MEGVWYRLILVTLQRSRVSVHLPRKTAGGGPPERTLRHYDYISFPVVEGVDSGNAKEKESTDGGLF